MAKLVYTSGPGGEGDQRARAAGTGEPAVRPPEKHDVRVWRETGGRRGKTVTVAAPFFVTRDAAAEMSARLKKLCGSGGTLVAAAAPDGAACFALEVQGDHVEKVAAELRQLGFRARAI